MKWLSCIIIVLQFISCQEDPKKVSLVGNALLSVNFSCGELTKDLTSSQEGEIKDINIYLFHRSQNISKREYITSSQSTSFNLPKGEYDVFVMANVGYDLGERTKTEIENMDVSISDETDLERDYSLLMSDRQTVNITDNTVLSVVLKRMVARCDVNINIASGFDFQLSSVRVVDAPRAMYYFGENNSSSGITYRSQSSTNFSFYMLENRKGVNWSITSERDKNSSVAPDKATYLHIIGTTNGVKTEYKIYLGENNTNSFNVVRNNNYRYDINIKGINEVDSRVSTTVVSFDHVAENYIVNEPIDTNIRLESTESQNQNYSLSVSAIEGNGIIRLNNTPYIYGGSVPFLQSGQQFASIPLSYVQSTPSPVQLRLTVTGSDGFSFHRDIFANYVKAPNKLEINNLTSTESRGGNPSNILFEVLKKEYSGVVKLKYELIKGVGTVKFKNAYISNNIEVNATVGNNELEFTPTEVQDAELKLTVTLDNGETVSKNVMVKVYRMTIEACIESSANRYGFVFYIDNIPATLNGSTLPINSCREIRISTTISWICNSCSREVKSGSLVENRLVQIKPKGQLISYGYWLTALHPTTISIAGCGNPGCSQHNLTARLNQNSGSLQVYYPVTKFVTFLNMKTYP